MGTIKEKELEIDKDGFLRDPGQWNEDVARALAMESEGIEVMTEDHWKVVKYVRDYYEKNGIGPVIRKLSFGAGLPSKKIFTLFPSGLTGAYKIAGVPRPSGCCM